MRKTDDNKIHIMFKTIESFVYVYRFLYSRP